MTDILIFGFGQMGKEVIDECFTYLNNLSINAIVDNNAVENQYRGIPIIKPLLISHYKYEEIWICTINFEEVIKQLVEEYALDKKKMHFIQPVVPVIEMRLRKKYRKEIEKNVCITDEKATVINYLKDNHLHMYCYPFYEEYLSKHVQIKYDISNGLYYGLYEGKPMYLSRKLNTEQKARAYFNSVTMEQDSRSPHCYWNNKNMKKASGVGVDVGAAEGIYALRIIDQIEHIFLIEADKDWIEALGYTFEPYKNKVTIINKFVDNENNSCSIKLDTLLKDEKIDFIKMDIEGMEYAALEGMENLLKKNNINLAVCVYHHQEDNTKISQWLKGHGYSCKNSFGYVVCQGEWELANENIDFRRALLFAEKE